MKNFWIFWMMAKWNRNIDKCKCKKSIPSFQTQLACNGSCNTHLNFKFGVHSMTTYKYKKNLAMQVWKKYDKRFFKFRSLHIAVSKIGNSTSLCASIIPKQVFFDFVHRIQLFSLFFFFWKMINWPSNWHAYIFYPLTYLNNKGQLYVC